ncbi:predicted protein [Histoplasma capsulatum var. duboisii H88]|uniref:Predicted protein n=1 Tax=Ajellomyces capsulatus (strain H88) TaxID=544711 RepID=F0UFA4_AJEC8|nr:predicted protein [Histoplasma capsulatum var. duboisii H88]
MIPKLRRKSNLRGAAEPALQAHVAEGFLPASRFPSRDGSSKKHYWLHHRVKRMDSSGLKQIAHHSNVNARCTSNDASLSVLKTVGPRSGGGLTPGTVRGNSQPRGALLLAQSNENPFRNQRGSGPYFWTLGCIALGLCFNFLTIIGCPEHRLRLKRKSSWAPDKWPHPRWLRNSEHPTPVVR